ncbi:MAG: hypothetical protein HY832_02130 [Candidatus Aenigmarchaeota archaeon]|nr:hypothetical protein [Candidatus Aenigmarchaeota archaeon]
MINYQQLSKTFKPEGCDPLPGLCLYCKSLYITIDGRKIISSPIKGADLSNVYMFPITDKGSVVVHVNFKDREKRNPYQYRFGTESDTDWKSLSVSHGVCTQECLKKAYGDIE